MGLSTGLGGLQVKEVEAVLAERQTWLLRVILLPRFWSKVEGASSLGSSLETHTGSSCAANQMGSPSTAPGGPGPSL